jgi:hypothetical protein
VDRYDPQWRPALPGERLAVEPVEDVADRHQLLLTVIVRPTPFPSQNPPTIDTPGRWLTRSSVLCGETVRPSHVTTAPTRATNSAHSPSDNSATRRDRSRNRSRRSPAARFYSSVG